MILVVPSLTFKRVADFPIVHASRHQVQHFSFPRCQRVGQIRRSRKQCPYLQMAVIARSVNAG